MAFTALSRALVVRPDAYRRARTDRAAPAGLTGRAVAAGPGAVGIGRGDRVRVRIGAVDLGPAPRGGRRTAHQADTGGTADSP